MTYSPPTKVGGFSNRKSEYGLKIPMCKCGHDKKAHYIDNYGRGWKCRINDCNCKVFNKEIGGLKIMEEPKQTPFDMACDAFYEALTDYGFEYSDEDANNAITPALKSFRDELRQQMGNDKFYAEYEFIKDNKPKVNNSKAVSADSSQP